MAILRLKKEVPGLLDLQENLVSTTIKSDFSKALDLLKSDKWEEALSQFKGEFVQYADWEEVSGEFAEWVTEKRELFSGRMAQGLLGGAESYFRFGDIIRSRELAEKSLDFSLLNPLDEATHLSLFQILQSVGSSRLGDLPPLRVIEADKTGWAEPSQERLRFFRIARPSLPFFGRTQELIRLKEMAEDEDCRLISIIGFLGTGKTRLALAFAESSDVAALFRDGVFVFGCKGIENEHDLSLTIENGLRQAFGLAGALEQREVDRILSEKKILIVLNYVDHLGSTIKPIISRLLKFPSVKILAVTRVPLDFPEEWKLRIGGLVDSSTGSSQSVSVKLFLHRARMVNSQFKADGRDLSIIEAICARVGYVPQLIEWAALWCETLSLEAVLSQLETNLIDTLMAQDIPKEEPLVGILQSIWKDLNHDEKKLLKDLVGFEEDLPLETAKEKLRFQMTCLSSLSNKGLVQINGPYISVVSLLRDFVNEKTSKSSSFRVPEEQHPMYSRQMESEIEAIRSNFFEGLSQSEIGVQQIFDAVEQWERQGNEIGGEFVDSISRYVLLRPFLVLSGDAVLATKGKSPQSLSRFEISSALSQIFYAKGEYIKGKKFAQTAVQIAIEQADTTQLREALSKSVANDLQFGVADLASAIWCYELSVGEAEIFRALRLISHVLRSESRIESLDFAIAANVIAREFFGIGDQVEALNELGIVQQRFGMVEEARTSFFGVRDSVDQISDYDLWVSNTVFIALGHLAQDDIDLAIKAFEGIPENHPDLRTPSWISFLSAKFWAAAYQGDLANCADLHRKLTERVPLEGHSTAINYVSITYFLLQRNASAAIERFEKLLENVPLGQWREHAALMLYVWEFFAVGVGDISLERKIEQTKQILPARFAPAGQSMIRSLRRNMPMREIKGAKSAWLAKTKTRIKMITLLEEISLGQADFESELQKRLDAVLARELKKSQPKKVANKKNPES